MAERTTPVSPAASPWERVPVAAAAAAAWAPWALVALAAAAVLLVSGVNAADIVVFAGFEVLFLALPGCLLYAALAPGDGALRTVAFGWALGHVIAMLAYLAAVSSGHPGLFPAYPLVVAAVALPLLVLQRRAPGRAVVREAPDAAWAWGVAGAAVVALAWYAVSFFPSTPLPGAVESVAYLRDIVFQLSATAEVRHHWPLTDPKVAGVSVAYHTFAYMYMAGIDQVTGLGLPVVVFRLAVLPLLVLFVLQLGVAGRVLARSRWVGPLAALVFLFVSELDLDSRSDTLQGFMPFAGGGAFIGVYLSPTYVAGLIFFVPAVVLVAEWLGLVDGARWSTGKWVVLGLLLAGCAGAKAMILPVLLGGLVVYAGLRALVERQIDRRAVIAIGAVGAVFLLFFVTLYGGAGLSEAGAKLGIGGSTRWIALVVALEQEIGSVARLPGVVFSVVAQLAAPLLGLLWFVRRGRSELSWRHGYLLSILAAALGPFILLEQPFGNDSFFISYGLTAAVLVSAEGLIRLWSSERTDRRGSRLVVVYGVAYVAALVVVSRISYRVVNDDSLSLARIAVVHLSWLAFVAAVLAGLVLVARLSPTVRPLLMRLVIVTVLAATALNIPFDVLPDLRTRIAAGEPLHREGDVTPALVNGLAWIREHSDDDDVLAVNRQSSNAYLPWTPGHPLSPDNFYVSGLAERRVFYEGTVYTAESFRLGVAEVEQGLAVPYPERKDLNDRVFRYGDPDALEILFRRYGVRYLVVDKAQRDARVIPYFRIVDNEAVLFRLPRVFDNAALAVYRVPAPERW